MTLVSSLYEHHSKAIKVILSCKTLEQLDVARKYCLVMLNLHGKHAVCLHKNVREFYIKKIQESEKFMNKALNDQRTTILRINRGL